jgi:hypothetical protein
MNIQFLEPGAIQDYSEAIKYKVGNRVKWSAVSGCGYL